MVIKKNKILFIFLGIISLVFIFIKIFYFPKVLAEKNIMQNPLKIAACPTCYEIAQKLDSEKYQIISTASTAESAELIKNKQADMMIAGRALKPNEIQLNEVINEVIIEDGYSFIADKSFSIYVDELKNYEIFTDLDVDFIKNNFPISKIEKVDNIYEYLDKGIIVTSWENTDYLRSEIVHVFEKNRERFKLSRRPTIYYPVIYKKEAKEIALLIKK